MHKRNPIIFQQSSNLPSYYKSQVQKRETRRALLGIKGLIKSPLVVVVRKPLHLHKGRPKCAHTSRKHHQDFFHIRGISKDPPRNEGGPILGTVSPGRNNGTAY